MSARGCGGGGGGEAVLTVLICREHADKRCAGFHTERTLCVCDLKCRCAIGNAASVTGDVCIVAAVTSTLQLVRS